MEIQVENRVDIEPVTDVEVAASNVAEVSVTDDTALDVSVVKKEYKIVGDEVYIAKLYEDAPQWMKDLVNIVVNNVVDTTSTTLLNDVVSSLNNFATSYVPLNTYTQSILDLSNADASMHATIETLNSNFNDAISVANAQIIELQLTSASRDDVSATVVDTLATELNTPTSYIGSIIGNLQQAIADGDTANATSVNTLTSTLANEVDARATAVEYLNTYVGIDNTGTATGTGLLNSIQELQNQVDGNISTWFYSGAPTLSTAPANGWSTAEEKANHVGDIYYDRLTGYGYRFAYEDIVDTPNMGVIYSWIRIVDTDVIKALADAAAAQETADGKITTFYQANAPTAEGVGDIWIDSNDGNKMYRWNGSSWGADLVGTMVANSSAVTNLTTALNNGTTTWAAADSQVTNSLTAKIENDVASVESKWEYNSVVGINGVYKRSGFGLTTNYTGGSGTEVNPYTSEFWIDATKLRFTNSAATGRTAPFTIDASGATPQITFNGRVSFTNVTGAPVVPTTYVQTSQPTGTVVGDTWIDSDDNNSLYTYNGSSWVKTQSGVKTYLQTTAPVSGMVIGDIWIDSDNNFSQYRWSGSGWAALAYNAAAAINANSTYIDGGKITANSALVHSLNVVGGIVASSISVSSLSAISSNLGTVNAGVIYNSGGYAGNYNMMINLDSGLIHIK